MSDDGFSALLTVVVPPVIRLIAEHMGIGETAATEAFYASKVYEWLSDEKSKTWHLSPHSIYRLYEQERRGEPLEWPEEVA